MTKMRMWMMMNEVLPLWRRPCEREREREREKRAPIQDEKFEKSARTVLQAEQLLKIRILRSTSGLHRSSHPLNVCPLVDDPSREIGANIDLATLDATGCRHTRISCILVSSFSHLSHNSCSFVVAEFVLINLNDG